MDPTDLQWLETPPDGHVPAELAFLALKETFVSGDPSGERLSVRYYRRTADDALLTHVLFGPATQGPPDHAHGGSMAALLDESMGGAAWVTGLPVVAAQLNVKFLAMLPLGTRCIIHAEVVAVAGRKVTTRGVLRNGSDGTEYCRAEGLFVTLDESRIEGLSEKARIIVEKMKNNERGR